MEAVQADDVACRRYMISDEQPGHELEVKNEGWHK